VCFRRLRRKNTVHSEENTTLRHRRKNGEIIVPDISIRNTEIGAERLKTNEKMACIPCLSLIYTAALMEG
jgi:hypothetical protein